MTKRQCFVLCRNRYIPAHVPMLPPKKLIRNKFASGILHACRFALLLSIPIAVRPAKFIMSKYTKRTFTKCKFYITPYFSFLKHSSYSLVPLYLKHLYFTIPSFKKAFFKCLPNILNPIHALLSVFPETFCKGLFNHIHKKFTISSSFLPWGSRGC